MPGTFAEDLMRELIDQIDARLREAERVRAQADDQYRDRPFWPDRRRTGRQAPTTTGRDPSERRRRRC